MNDMLRRLHERRDSAVAARRRIVEMAKRERRDADRLTESEDREFRSLSEQVKEYDERIAELENAEARTAGAQRASAAWTGGGWRSESRVYTPDGPHSYVRDLVSTVRQTADMDARQRLATYEQEQRDLNRADGSGGTFVPPALGRG